LKNNSNHPKEGKIKIANFVFNSPYVSTLIFTLGIFYKLLTLIIPVSIGKFYEIAFKYNSVRSKILNFLPHQWTNSITGFLIFFIIIVLLKFIFYMGYRITLRTQSEKFIKLTKDQLFLHQMAIDLSIYKEKGVGKYLLRYSGDINSLKNLLTKGTIEPIVNAIILLIAFNILFILNSEAGIVILLSSIVFFGVLIFLNKRLEYFAIRKRDVTSGQLSFVSRTLQAIKSVQVFGLERTETKAYSKRSSNILGESTMVIKWDAIIRGSTAFFQYALLVPVLFIFGKDVQSDISNGGQLLSFILLYITILPIISSFMRLPSIYKLGNISLEKLNKILGLKTTFDLGTVLKVKNPRVEFKDIMIDGSDKTLNLTTIKNGINDLNSKDFDFSELVSIFLKLNPTKYSGSILINEKNINIYSNKSLRKNIGIVSSNLPFIGRYVKDSFRNLNSSKREKVVKPILQKVNFLLSEKDMHSWILFINSLVHQLSTEGRDGNGFAH